MYQYENITNVKVHLLGFEVLHDQPPNTMSFQENKYGSRNRIFLQKSPYGKIKIK